MNERHIYVEGRAINVCLWCGRGPEDASHDAYEYGAMTADELREQERVERAK